MILRARYVLPMDGSVIEDSEVLVRGGDIAAVGTGLSESYPNEELRDLSACAVLPGFVNAHSHIEPTLRRSFRDGLNLWDWLHQLGFRRDTSPPAELLQASALLGAAECACSGVTCLGDSSFSGASAGAIEAVGLRGIVYREIFGQSMEAQYREHFAARLAEVREMQSRVSGLLRIGISPHSVYTSPRELIELCAEACAEQSIPVAFHLAETRAETDYLIAGAGPIADMRRRQGYEPMASGIRPARLLLEAGMLREGVCLAHCVHLSDDEIELVARSGASVAHCPRSNACLGAGIAPLPGFIAAGAAVGIGTDSSASCLGLDFFEEMRFALALHRAAAKDAGAISAKSVLEMGTIGGARALGLSDRIGTLEAGKRADMIAVDLSEALPGEDIWLAVLSRGPADVRLALVDGVEVVRNGRTTRVRIDDCRAALQEGMERFGVR